MNIQKGFYLLLMGSLVCIGNVTGAEEKKLSCPKIFGNGMVIQRGMKVPIWGWGKPNTEVSVTFADKTERTSSDANGKWRVTFDSMKASSESRDMTITAGDQKLTFTNVLVGEVWLASGQSNMEWPLKKTRMKWKMKGDVHYEVDFSDIDMALIRVMTAEKTLSYTPKDTFDGGWVSLGSPEGQSSSAVASFFAMNLVRELKVPVGIICTAWGGACIEPWIPKERFALIEGVKQGKKKLSKDEMDNMAKKPWNLKLPGLMYNTLVYPLLGIAMRGVLWYQGESNVGDRLYEQKMLAMIEAWRKAWNIGDFPFYYVQLAPLGRYGGEKLGRMWEAQLNILSSVPNTGMVVSADCRQVKNIHPQNKPIIGRRLSLWALAKTYGKTTKYSGPLYKDYTIRDDKVIIEFDHAEGGLAFKGPSITEVYIQGKGDEEFIEASPTIEGSKLIVTHPKGKEPLSVRMGWNNRLAMPNLMNKEGLPASPFCTEQQK